MSKFSVVIAATARQIWPFLFRGDKWQWFEKVECVALAGDQVGGIVALYTNALSCTPNYFIKTVKIEPHRHYGFAVYGLGNRFYGFGMFDLNENREGGTSVSYELYLHNLSGPSAEATDAQRRAIADEEERDQQTDKSRKLAILKALVESSSSSRT
jgi:hypothetical protein